MIQASLSNGMIECNGSRYNHNYFKMQCLTTIVSSKLDNSKTVVCLVHM